MNIDSNRIFYHVPIHRLINNLDHYLCLGVNFEIYINADFIDGHKKEDIDRVNKGFQKKGILKRIHGPFIDLCPGSFDARVRQLSQERILAGLDICNRLMCSDIVLHSHYDPVYHKRHLKQWADNSSQIWKKVQDLALELGITVNIENSEDDTPEPIFYLLERYNSFRACFDLAHYTIFGKSDWRDILDAYPEGYINEIHLSDNDKQEDLHLVLGEGSVEIEALIDEIASFKHKPVITIEPHSDEDMLKDIEYMKRLQS